MRFLQPAVPEQIRFGWLPVIAGLVGQDRFDLTVLRDDLIKQSDRFAGWVSEAGLQGVPGGNVQKARADRLARMGVTYGIYNDVTGSLTDLGHVLRVVSSWTRDSKDSPFLWKGGKKWIGLRVLFEGAGDAVLGILRTFPKGAVVDGAASIKLVNNALTNLLECAGRDEKAELRKQIQRAAGKQAREALVYPYLEPLRDLGYLGHRQGSGASGYRLTPCGIRLRDALALSGADASSLVRNGLLQAFLKAEDLSTVRPANAEILRSALAELPSELTVSSHEAPLEPVVLLAQAHLIESDPGTWIDMTLAHELLREVGARSDGKVYLKSGQSIHDTPNIAWTDAELLRDRAIWEVALEPGRTVEISPQRSERSPANGVEQLFETSAPEEPDQSATAASRAQLDLPAGADDGPHDRAPAQTVDPHVLLDSSISGSLRLWFQYVTALLQPLRLGAIDLPRWGGFATSLSRLQAILELPEKRLPEKRSKNIDPVSTKSKEQILPACLLPLRRAAEASKELEGNALIGRVCKHWVLETETARNPKAAIERAISFLPTLQGELRIWIESYINETNVEPNWEKWPRIREATRCLIQDSLSEGIWGTRELFEQMTTLLASQPTASGAASSLLGELTGVPRAFVYRQRKLFQERLTAELGLEATSSEISDGSTEPAGLVHVIGPRSVETEEGTRTQFELYTTMEARSEFEAQSIGRTRVRLYLLSYYARRSVSLTDNDYETLKMPPSSESVQELNPGFEKGARLSTTAHAGLSFGKLCAGQTTQYGIIEPGKLMGVLERPAAASPIALRRIARACQGLAVAHDPDRSSAERLVLAWSAIEQLVRSGAESKAKAIHPFASAAAILHLRSELSRIHRDAMTGLVAAAILTPAQVDVQQQVSTWLPHKEPEFIPFKDIPPVIRKARLAGGDVPHIDEVSDREALRRLWRHLEKIDGLRAAIEPVAPLASTSLFDFQSLLVDRKASPKEVGNGKALGDYFRNCYDDFVAFLFYVYELRNRFVHDGEGFDGSRHIAITEVLDRFLAVVEPVVTSLYRHVHEHNTSLDRFWHLTLDIAHDLVGLDEKPKLTRPRLEELLFGL